MPRNWETFQVSHQINSRLAGDMGDDLVVREMVRRVSDELAKKFAPLLRKEAVGEPYLETTRYTLSIGIPSLKEIASHVVQLDEAYERGLNDAMSMARAEQRRLMQAYGVQMAHGAEASADAIGRAIRRHQESRESDWMPMPAPYRGEYEFLTEDGRIARQPQVEVAVFDRAIMDVVADPVPAISPRNTVIRDAIAWRPVDRRVRDVATIKQRC